MIRKAIAISVLFTCVAAGCYQAVQFNTPPGDADVRDDAAAHDGQDLQDQDARPDAPEPPDAVEAADDGDLIHDPHPDDGPQDDATFDDATDVETADGEDALDEDVVADAADVEEEEIFEPYPAGDFTLTDYNADSPTYLQERTLSGARGKVVLLFFLSYG